MKSWVRNSLRAGVLAAGFLLFIGSPAQAHDQITTDNSGIGTGNNISVPITAAGTFCGNGGGGAGLGVGVSDTCKATSTNTEGAEDAQLSTKNSGILTGNNVSNPWTIAGTFCGNGGGGAGVGVGVSDSCKAAASNEAGNPGLQATGDNSGIGVGNNWSSPVAWATPVCGNGVGIFGVGVGVSDSCAASASNGESTGSKRTLKKALKSGREVTSETLPGANAPMPAPAADLPAPVEELAGPVLDTIQAPAQGNSINVPGLT
ncbi:MAG: hypothetical protein ACRDT4_02145 [Micromonosporaceae bacterium]